MSATPQHAARVLGLGLDATLEDVRRVRRKMALKYHPDCCEDQERSTRHMARINAAADTLIAYIKNKPSFRPKAKPQPSRTGKARRASARSGTSKASSASRTRNTHRDEARSQSKAEHASGARPSRPTSKPSRAEATLIRFASDSYAKVLDRIGRIETGPTIDVRVMGY